MGSKPGFFGKKIPTRRDEQKYQSLQKVKNPIHEARRYQQIYELTSVQTYAQVAQHFGVSRARVCQMLNLLRLPDEILDYVEDLDEPEGLKQFTERRLRKVIRSEESVKAFQAEV